MSLLTAAAASASHPLFTPDPEPNRRSIRKLAELEPVLVCPGHGPPFRDLERAAPLDRQLLVPASVPEGASRFGWRAAPACLGVIPTSAT